MCMAVDSVLCYGPRVFGTTVSGVVSPWTSGSGFSADCMRVAVDGVLFDGLHVFGTTVSGGVSP